MTNKTTFRQTWIFDLLKVQNLGFSEMFSKYFEKFSKSQQTFNKDWKKANESYLYYQEKLNYKKENASIDLELNSIKLGLKTKIERVLEYEKIINDCNKELKDGWTYDFRYDADDKRYVDMNRQITVHEKTLLRKTIKDCQSEISKIQGDYAPVKKENKDVTEFSSDEIDAEIQKIQNELGII